MELLHFLPITANVIWHTKFWFITKFSTDVQEFYKFTSQVYLNITCDMNYGHAINLIYFK